MDYELKSEMLIERYNKLQIRYKALGVKGLTMKKLGVLIGLSYSMISLWKDGKRKMNPTSLDILGQIILGEEQLLDMKEKADKEFRDQLIASRRRKLNRDN